MNRFLRSVVLPLPLLLLSSCLGIDVLGDQVGQVKRPGISVLQHVLRRNDEPTVTIEASQVIEWWGEPDERATAEDGSERLTYYDGVRWKGVLLFLVVLPVPLVVPVGHDYVELEVVDGQIITARTCCDETLFEAFAGWPLHGMWFGVNSGTSRGVGEQFQRY